MQKLAAGWCQFTRDDALSAERGLPARPHVFRCGRCGFVAAPCATADGTKVRRRCKWHDPKVSGFDLSDECWCRGLGDVLERLFDCATRWLPWRARLLKFAGGLVDRLEARLQLRDERRHAGERGGCGGCQARRVSLNARFPLVWLRKRICPPIVRRQEETGPVAVCFVFPHGFGDAVQFTAVLRHLQKHRPNWRMSIYCKAGAHSLFRGYVERVGVMDRDNLGKVYQDDYALVHPVRWFEPEVSYHDSPSTKVERCLREEFGITPEPELWDYRIESDAGERHRAAEALGEIAERRGDGRFRVVAVHYQGNSWRSSKNLDEAIVRDVVDTIRAAGYVPLILDWEPGFRSSILRERTRGVKCFGHDHPLWKGLGVGDGAALYALLAQVELVVGIDSGPEHLAAATTTETLVVWGRQTHPLNYFSPAQNVLHIVRRDQGKHLRGDRDTGERFFRAHYRYHELDKHLRVALPELAASALRSGEFTTERRIHHGAESSPRRHGGHGERREKRSD